MVRVVTEIRSLVVLEVVIVVDKLGIVPGVVFAAGIFGCRAVWGAGHFPLRNDPPVEVITERSQGFLDRGDRF